jgi:hypothetical protein
MVKLPLVVREVVQLSQPLLQDVFEFTLRFSPLCFRCNIANYSLKISILARTLSAYYSIDFGIALQCANAREKLNFEITLSWQKRMLYRCRLKSFKPHPTIPVQCRLRIQVPSRKVVAERTMGLRWVHRSGLLPPQPACANNEWTDPVSGSLDQIASSGWVFIFGSRFGGSIKVLWLTNDGTQGQKKPYSDAAFVLIFSRPGRTFSL